MTETKILEKRENGIVIFEMKQKEIRVIVTNLGCTILSVFVPDRNGVYGDVVLGFEHIEDSKTDGSYFGALVGRIANRIGDAQFDLNGKHYTLAANNGKNHLHGGDSGFDQKLFDYEILADGICFTCVSPDGEEGYPGTLQVKVDYILTEHSLEINYCATADQDTIVNLTNHSYFNLSAGQEKIYHHQLYLNADQFGCVDDGCLATGELHEVEGTPFDFRQMHEIGEHIQDKDEQLKNAGGYDHTFVLNQGDEQIILYHEPSGRELHIHTSAPQVQLYSGNFLAGGANGKNGKPYENGDGVALETQLQPNSIHVEKEPSVILRKGQVFRSHTSYSFVVR